MHSALVDTPLARPIKNATLAPPRHLALAVLTAAALLACWAPGSAHADELDTLQWRAGQSVQNDNNVFRTPDSARVSDTIGVTTLGVKIDKRYSLQRLELDLSTDAYRYRDFSQLNFNAVNYTGALRWSVTPALYGNLVADRRDYLDRLAPTAVGALNRRVERQTGFDAEYELAAAVHALGGVFERSITNSESFTLEPNSTVRGGEVGARYVLASGNSVAYRFRQGNGSYDSRVDALGVVESFPDFRDREHEVELQWAPTGRTRVNGRLAYVDRTHDGAAQRDFSGWRGRINANWDITGKTSLVGGLVNELGSYGVGHYDGYRLFVGPVWKATEKIVVRLRYDHGQRQFKGIVPDRQDRQDVATLAVEWSPIRALRLVGSWQRDQRRSDQAGLDYKATIYSVAALASF